MNSTAPTPRVLLVDDNSHDLTLLSEAFANIGSPVEIETCTTGHLAFANLQVMGLGGPLPDLLVLDLRMPGITGIELLHVLKESAGLKSIPVVMITASATVSDREQCAQYGAVELIEKPMDFPAYLVLARHLAGIMRP